MRRLAQFLVRNWPLKLAAIGLATVLYAGVVVSGNSRIWPGQVPIEIVDPPSGGVLLDLPGSVGQIRYRAPLDVAGRLTSDTFRATLDLSGQSPEAGGPPTEVAVRLISLDPRVQIVDYAPRTLNIRLDSVVTRSMPVTVSSDEAPVGFVLGPPQTDPSMVVLRGATSRLSDVAQARVRVPVDASGLNIDQEVGLDIVDASGNLVAGVEAVPDRVRVRIDVARELTYASLPVVAALTGSVAPGYRLDSIAVEPVTVTVSGEATTLGTLTSIATRPIELGEATADRVVDTTLVLPPDISLVGDPGVRVTLHVVPEQASRTREVGVVPLGGRRDRVYSLSSPSVLVTLAGTQAALDALDGVPDGVTAQIALDGLTLGRHEVPVTVDAPTDVSVTSVAPIQLVVRVSIPETTASPPPAASAGPDAVASPSAGPSDVPGGPGGSPADGAPADAPTVPPSGAPAASPRGAPSPAPSGGT